MEMRHLLAAQHEVQPHRSDGTPWTLGDLWRESFDTNYDDYVDGKEAQRFFMRVSARPLITDPACQPSPQNLAHGRQELLYKELLDKMEL